ncbi:hypothetical protein [Campylobacter sp. 1]|uniref:hypothetical protein n=1 Tax=Campylobacter sp. 1 TaxID=2039344 RepID=UPI0015DD752E|nr:hypothetical protein [Campylobacter sp. 1]
MDHIWNDLKNWEEIWIDELKREKEGPDHEHKQHNIDLLTKQLASIQKALKEIAKWV